MAPAFECDVCETLARGESNTRNYFTGRSSRENWAVRRLQLCDECAEKLDAAVEEVTGVDL